jgi:hypothetical protein
MFLNTIGKKYIDLTKKFLSDKAVSTYILVFLFTGIFLNLSWLYITQTKLFADISGNLIVELTNQTRIKDGLKPLNVNSDLSAAAAAKAADMIKNGYFAHFSPTNISPWFWIKQNGYNYKYAGENLAMNFSETNQVIDGWLDSPTHKANLLNVHYEDIGVAVLSGQVNGANRVVVVQMFGSPKVPTNSIVPRAEAAETATTKTSTTKAVTTTTLSKPTTTKTTAATTTITSTTLLTTTSQTIATPTTIPGKVIGLETNSNNNSSLKEAALISTLKFGTIHKINGTLMITFWILLGFLSLGIVVERLINKRTDNLILGRLVTVLAIALAYTFISNGFFFPPTVIMNA